MKILNINYSGTINKGEYRKETFKNIRNFALIAIILSFASSVLEKNNSSDIVFILSFMQDSVLRALCTNLNFLLSPSYNYLNFSVFLITFLIPLIAILSLTPIVLSQLGLMIRRKRDLLENPLFITVPFLPYIISLLMFSEYGAQFMRYTGVEWSVDTYVFIYILARAISLFLVVSMLWSLFFKPSVVKTPFEITKNK